MIVSSDSHVVEPPEIFSVYASARWRDVAPRCVASPSLGDVFTLEGMSLVLPVNEITGGAGRARADLPEASCSSRARLVYQRAAGINAELLFPTVGLFLPQHPDLRYYHEFAWAYNRWLAEEWSGTRRLGLVALLGDHRSVPDRRRAVEFAVHHRMVGLLLPSEPFEGRWSDLEYASFFRDIADAGLLACFHAFSRPIRPRMSRRAAAIFAAAHEGMDVLTEMAIGGVMERESSLRVLFGEGGTWWLREWSRRLTDAGVSSAELARRVRVTAGVAPASGAEFVAWASDYPHGILADADGAPGSAQRNNRGTSDEFFNGSLWYRPERETEEVIVA